MAKITYVYLIEEKDSDLTGRTRRFKIGITTDLKKRLEQLKTGNCNELEPRVCVMSVDAEAYEKASHLRLREYAMQGEWFQMYPNQLAVIVKHVRRLDDPSNWVIPEPRIPKSKSLTIKREELNEILLNCASDHARKLAKKLLDIDMPVYWNTRDQQEWQAELAQSKSERLEQSKSHATRIAKVTEHYEARLSAAAAAFESKRVEQQAREAKLFQALAKDVHACEEWVSLRIASAASIQMLFFGLCLLSFIAAGVLDFFYEDYPHNASGIFALNYVIGPAFAGIGWLMNRRGTPTPEKFRWSSEVQQQLDYENSSEDSMVRWLLSDLRG